jgi:hypothetical protein
MSDTATTTGTNGGAEPPSRDSAIHGLSMVFGDTVKHLATMADSQQVAILATTAIMAMLPGVGKIDPTQLAVVVQALTQSRKDGDPIRERITTYVSMVVSLAEKLPEVVAEMEAKSGKKSTASN